MSDYDAIVIGAGNGGLTAAATLQRRGARTLLLEKHNVPGGCGTSFRRGRFEFEVALHQLSGVGHEGQQFSLREGLFHQLGIADTLEFVEEHELYRAVVPGKFDVTLPADWDGIIDALETAFPGNRDRAAKFFDLVKQVTFWQTAAMRGMPPGQIDPLLFKYGLRSSKDVLDEYFNDEGLKSALGMYWTYQGQPPSKLPFQDLAVTLFAYLEFKPWHVRGGSQAMSTAILDAFLRAGGEVHFNSTVAAILTSKDRVCGVRLADGTEIGAPDVISNISLPITYGMLEDFTLPTEVRKDLGTRRVGVSGFVLHMGLDATPAELGFTTSSMFINADTDDDRMFESWRSLAEKPRGVFATCYDVEPIGFSPSGASHVSLMTLQYAEAWKDVAPEDYARTKFAYAESVIEMVEHVTPGIRGTIEEVDVATPLTMMRYLGHPGGTIYGYDQDATEGWLFRNSETQSNVQGLHLAGSWAGMGGFQPTLQAGARAAKRVLRSSASSTSTILERDSRP